MTDAVEPKSAEREAIELYKLSLEAEKLKLDIEDVQLQQERRKAENRKALAEAIQHEQIAVMHRIERRKREAAEEREKNSDANNFTYRFAAGVDEESVHPLLDTINTWHRQDPTSKWNIVIDSPGGYCVDGYHLIDQLVEYSVRGGGSHYITMTVRGMAASMGGIILQAADERVIGRHAQVLIHEVSAGAFGSIGQIEDRVKYVHQLQDSAIDLFMERANPKTMSRKKFINSWRRTDWWLTAKQTVKYGFADRIG